MRFPFVKRKDYEEVVYKLERLLCEASGGRLSKHTYPLETMCDALRAYTQFCCDEAVEEKTRELEAEIEVLTAQNGVNETCSARKQETIEHLETELKAMRGAANSYKLHYGNMRMEIAREFADRVKAKGTMIFGGAIVVFDNNIDDLIKEMEKEDEDSKQR